MFRDGAVLVDPDGLSILPHEEISPARVDAFVREWTQSGGVQETPITVLVDAGLPARSIIADGHHRCAAARVMARRSGKPVAVAARFFSQTEQAVRIMPAHRVIRGTGDEGWVQRCAALLRERLRPAQGTGSLGFGVRGGQVERYESGELSPVDQMHLLHSLAELDGCDWTIEAEESEALAELAAGRAEAIILVPTLTLADVLTAATTGRLLPPRSTNFQPKPPDSSIRFTVSPPNQ